MPDGHVLAGSVAPFAVAVVLPLHAQEEAVEQDHQGDAALEVQVLHNVVDEGLREREK